MNTPVSSIMIAWLECLNFQFFMLGLALLISGIYLSSGYNIMRFSSVEMVNNLILDAEKLGFEIKDPRLTPAAVFDPLGVILFRIGLVSVFVSCVGAIAWRSTNAILIRIHIVLDLILLLVVTIATLVTLVRGNGVFDIFTSDSVVTSTLENYYGLTGHKGDEMGRDATDTWNAVMSHFKCCGLFGATDFEDLPEWPGINTSDSLDLVTPLMCCKNKTLDHSCAKKGTANPENNWMDIGCYQRFNENMFSCFICMVCLILYVAVLVGLNILSLYCARALKLEAESMQKEPRKKLPRRLPFVISHPKEVGNMSPKRKDQGAISAQQSASHHGATRSSRVDTGSFSSDEDSEDEQYSEEGDEVDEVDDADDADDSDEVEEDSWE